MKKYTVKIIIAVAIAAMISMPAAYAEFGRGDHEGREGKHGKVMKKIMEDLDISPEQKVEIDKNRKEHHEKKKALREEMKVKKQQLKDELKENAPDRGKINRTIDEISDIQKKLLRQRVDGVLEMKEILTEEQFTQLHEKMENTRKRHKGKKGRE